MIKCLGIVTFDVKIGQKLQLVVPANFLDTTEPDKLASLGIPENSNSNSDLSLPYIFSFYNDDGKHMEKLFVYCLFLQKPNPDLQRNFFQKTIFVCSSLFIPSIFFQTLHALGGELYESSAPDRFAFKENKELEPILEATYDQLCKWNVFETSLMFFGNTLSFDFTKEAFFRDKCVNSCFLQCVSCFKECIAEKDFAKSEFSQEVKNFISSCFNSYFGKQKSLLNENFPVETSFSFFKLFSEKIVALFHLWELLLRGKSVLIISPNAQICSSFVLFLLGLLRPLNGGFDYLPYFNNLFHEFGDIKYLQNFKVFIYKVVGCASIFYGGLLDRFDCVVYIKDIATPIKMHKAVPTFSYSFSAHFANSKQECMQGVFYRENCSPLIKFSEENIKTTKKLVGKKDSSQQNFLLKELFIELTSEFLKAFNSYFGFYKLFKAYSRTKMVDQSIETRRRSNSDMVYEIFNKRSVPLKKDFEIFLEKSLIYNIDLSQPVFDKKAFLEYMKKASNDKNKIGKSVFKNIFLEKNVFFLYKDFITNENFLEWFDNFQKLSFNFLVTYYAKHLKDNFDISLLSSYSFIYLLNRLERNLAILRKSGHMDVVQKIEKLLGRIKDLSSLETVI